MPKIYDNIENHLTTGLNESLGKSGFRFVKKINRLL